MAAEPAYNHHHNLPYTKWKCQFCAKDNDSIQIICTGCYQQKTVQQFESFETHHANAASLQLNDIEIDNDKAVAIEDISKKTNYSNIAQKCGKIFILFVSFMWLFLSSFTLTGFVLSFTKKEAMFRISFIFFNWFMTIINLPPIMRYLLKSLKIYQPQMDQFHNKCIYFLNRFMYFIVFIGLNILNTALIINRLQNLACFFIGIYNIILAFRLGAYLAIRQRSKFHMVHFCMLSMLNMLHNFIVYIYIQ